MVVGGCARTRTDGLRWGVKAGTAAKRSAKAKKRRARAAITCGMVRETVEGGEVGGAAVPVSRGGMAGKEREKITVAVAVAAADSPGACCC